MGCTQVHSIKEPHIYSVPDSSEPLLETEITPSPPSSLELASPLFSGGIFIRESGGRGGNSAWSFWKRSPNTFLVHAFLLSSMVWSCPFLVTNAEMRGYGVLGLKRMISGQILFGSLIELCLGVHNFALSGLPLLLC